MTGPGLVLVDVMSSTEDFISFQRPNTGKSSRCSEAIHFVLVSASVSAGSQLEASVSRLRVNGRSSYKKGNVERGESQIQGFGSGGREEILGVHLGAAGKEAAKRGQYGDRGLQVAGKEP